MGADAFWFCDTCKIKQYPNMAGGRNYLAVEGMFSEPSLTWQEISNWIMETKKLVSDFSSAGDDILHSLLWFEELCDFLKRHDGHEIILTSDFGGSLNISDYKDEKGQTWDRRYDYVYEGETPKDKPDSLNRVL